VVCQPQPQEITLSSDSAITADVRRVLPWLVATALFMEHLDATILNTAVPAMAASLGVEPLSLKSVVTSYMLSLAVFIPISGWMADRFGTRRVFVLALALFMLGSLLCGLATSAPWLVAARVIQGTGGALMTPVGRLVLVRSFPRSELITTMNYVIIPALMGPLLGPLVGGLIVHWLHWRVIFFVNLPFGLAGLWFAKHYMPAFQDHEVARFDWPGFVLFGSGAALLSYVLEVFGEHGLSGGRLGMMTAVAAALLLAYGWHASRIPAPVLKLALFRLRTFRLAVGGGFLTRLGIGGMPFLLPLLYQIGMGLPAWQAGLLMMPQAFAAILMKLISNRILARWGHKRILIFNTACFGGTIMAFSLVGPATPLAFILTLSFMQGFFASLQFTSMNSLVYAEVDDREASKANSIASTSQQLSTSFAVAVVSLVTAWYLGSFGQTNPAHVIAALHNTYLTMGALTILSAMTFLGLHGNDGDNVSNRRVLTTQAATP
jgi:EmrB/QacA subfamily drug resistance transporter